MIGRAAADLLSCMCYRLLFVTLVLLYLCSQLAWPEICGGKEGRAPEALILEVKEKQLWKDIQWLRLGHYRQTFFLNNTVSYIDSESFFLSSSGRSDPRAELIASLHGFFTPVSGSRDDNHPQCQYPARYNWLRNNLDFKSVTLPEPACHQYKNWLGNILPTGVTLIFAEAYLNNPASMFGHTFLRLDFENLAGGSDLLANTIGFAAHAADEKSLLYAFRGLTGGYEGKFLFGPYHDQVRTYGYMENRDIWEYHLSLETKEIRRMLDHLWELFEASFDYYFLDENCSYHLLSLLEVANPSLSITDKFALWTIPGDTVKIMDNFPGLINKVRYRPSRRRIVSSMVSAFSTDEIETLKTQIVKESRLDSGLLSKIGMERIPQFLDLAIEYSQLVAENSDNNTIKEHPLLAELLSLRSRISEPPAMPSIDPPRFRPDQGHGSARFDFALGTVDSNLFLQAGYRPVLHDLLDNPTGFVSGAKISFLETAIRFYPEGQQVQLEAVTLVDVLSLPENDNLARQFSWKAGFKVARKSYGQKERKMTGMLYGGIGHNISFKGGLLVYGMIKVSFYQNNYFDDGIGFGVGPELGLLINADDNWRIKTSVEAEKPFRPDGRIRHLFYQECHFDITKDYGLRLSFSNDLGSEFEDDQISLNWFHYF